MEAKILRHFQWNCIASEAFQSHGLVLVRQKAQFIAKKQIAGSTNPKANVKSKRPSCEHQEGRLSLIPQLILRSELLLQKKNICIGLEKHGNSIISTHLTCSTGYSEEPAESFSLLTVKFTKPERFN